MNDDPTPRARQDWEDLADGELLARLNQRWPAAPEANRGLVEDRDNPAIASLIDDLLGQ